MDQILLGLSKYTIFNHEKVRIDSRICEFHYRLTTILLFTFTSIISIAEIFGTPIDCVQSGSPGAHPVPEKIINSFCFIQTTFTYISQDKTPLTYPGVVGTSNSKDKQFQYYYQWVPVMLFLQAFVLLTPHFLWKQVEDSLMSKLLRTNDHYLLMTPAARTAKFRKVSGYLIKRHGSFFLYGHAYLLHILFNTAAVLFNIYTSELLLQGYFKYLGVQFANYMWTRENPTYLTNPLDITFPKMTKCTFQKYGPSGSLVSLDAMCLLPLNNFNEKIFIVLWFWYLFLFCISICYSVLKIIQWLSINVNIKLLVKMYFDADGLMDEDMKNLLVKLDVGQWLVIDIIRLNLSPLYYKEFLKSLAAKVQNKTHNNIIPDEACIGNGQAQHSFES